MATPWSISTTVRNPERIKNFLRVLSTLEGQKWNHDTQEKFQILLIQKRLYGYGEVQFYNGLTEEEKKLLDSGREISYQEAKTILDNKKYEGGGEMRGRQSFNPIKKMGFAYIDGNDNLRLTATGRYFLGEESELGNVFLKCFLKWSLHTKDDVVDIAPFITTLIFISKVNIKWEKLKRKPVGVSRKEFSIFTLTLLNYKDIDKVTDEIIQFRLQKEKSKDKKEFIKIFEKKYIAEFIESKDEKEIQKTISKLQNYADNVIRYFRLTRLIHLRGEGYYVDLEPRRTTEIGTLLEKYTGEAHKFKNDEEKQEWLENINEPTLPWETENHLLEIINGLVEEINTLEDKQKMSRTTLVNMSKLKIKELQEQIKNLRARRRVVQETIDKEKSKDLEEVKKYVQTIKEILSKENRALQLEKYSALGLNALNDALSIQPNYVVGDDNEPINTAPGGKPDIECFYEQFNAICEVTILRSRDQWYNEGQPVMRHLKDFEEANPGKKAYCLFVAPAIHRDTGNTFWHSVKFEFEGKKLRIIPLTTNQFTEMLQTVISLGQKKKKLRHQDILELYDEITTVKTIDSSIEWLENIPSILNNWKKKMEGEKIA